MACWKSSLEDYFDVAAGMKGVTGTNMLSLLERRLDNVVYRMGIGESRAQARQFVLHGHILVNGKKVDIPSYRVNVGDVDRCQGKERKPGEIQGDCRAGDPSHAQVAGHLTRRSSAGTVVAIPERDDIDLTIEEHLIVELYSK